VVHDLVDGEVVDEKRDEDDQPGDDRGLERERAALRKKGGQPAAPSLSFG
jgi:hypothetical protein